MGFEITEPTEAKWINKQTGGHQIPLGVRVLGHKSLGRVVICDSLRSASDLMQSKAMAESHKRGNDTCPNLSNNVDDPRWRGLPQDMWHKSWQNTMAAVYTAEPKFDEDTRKKVLEALPKTVRTEMETEFHFTHNPGAMNMTRLFEGRENFMRRMKSIARPVPVIGLGVNVCANANINASIAGIRGQVASIAAKILEKRGFMVEIFAIESGSNAYSGSRSGVGNGNCSIIKVKSAGERFIESHVSNALSAWFFRTGFFSLIRFGDSENVKRGLGSAKTLGDEDCANIANMLNVDEFTMLRYTPRSNDRKTNIEQAVKSLVDDVLQKYE